MKITTAHVLKFVRSNQLFESSLETDLSPIQGVLNLNNEVFKLRRGHDLFFVRMATDHGLPFGIRRAEEIHAMTLASKAGISPTIIHHNERGDFITVFIKGRHWSTEDLRENKNLERLAGLVRPIHSLSWGAQPGPSILDRIERMIGFAVTQKFPAPDDLDKVLARSRKIFDETSPGATSLNHNDLWLNNFLDDGKRLWAIDWEFSGTGNGLHDLNTSLLATQCPRGFRKDFFILCGRDPLWAEAMLSQYQFLVHAFEGTWALIMHGLRGSALTDYKAMSKSHFDKMKN